MSDSRNAVKCSFMATPAESLATLCNNIFDDVMPKFVNSENKQVDINFLRGKNMVLLFSEPDISEENIALLHRMDNDTCKIVWIPIVRNWNDDLKESVRLKRTKIPGYSVEGFVPKPWAIEYISNIWEYNRTPKLVMMDKRGDVKITRDVSKIPEIKNDRFPFF